MPKYLIASVRGKDFEAEGDTPEEAWLNLFHAEKDNGTLWRVSDVYRNQRAVRDQGFTWFNPDDPMKGVWKLIQ
jgi:hypothetical protein